MRPAWLDQFIAAVKPRLPPDFVGRIEVNAFKGGISSINVQQWFKEDEEHRLTR